MLSWDWTDEELQEARSRTIPSTALELERQQL